MAFRHICFAYYWATSGGVERVFLNRSEALLRIYPDLRIDLFFHNDWGGVSLVERYIKARHLGDRVTIGHELDPSRYDSIFVVDSPQLIADHPSAEKKMIMECHTPYPEGRTYLALWQHRIDLLLVPSSGFVKVLEGEYPGLRGKIKVIRNFVPQLPLSGRAGSLPAWCGPLFLYFARFDDLKNFSEFVAGVCAARRHFGHLPLGLACGQTVPGYSAPAAIENQAARGSVVLLPPVPFENGHILMQMVRQKRGVFVSCSKGESFGLSAAEAMLAGLPVILSDIPPHSVLVSHRAKFLYRLGDVRQLSAKMAAVFDRYDEMAAECQELSREFSEQSFLRDWGLVFG